MGAPLYRLSTAAYARSFATLLSDAAVSESEAYAIIACFTEVETVNRGLDRTSEAPDQEHFQAEAQRAMIKAKRLTMPTPGSSNFYSDARAALDKHYVGRLTT